MTAPNARASRELESFGDRFRNSPAEPAGSQPDESPISAPR